MPSSLGVFLDFIDLMAAKISSNVGGFGPMSSGIASVCEPSASLIGSSFLWTRRV